MRSISELAKVIESVALDDFKAAILDCPSLLCQSDSDGRHVLHHVISSGRSELLEWLLDSQPSVLLNEKDEDDWTPLHIAASKRRPDLVQMLIQRMRTQPEDGGASLDAFLHAKTINGQTALHYAVSKKDAKSMDILLQAGARANVKDALGQSPLHRAATVDCPPEMLTRLVHAAPAQIHSADLQGDSPLHLAIENGHVALAKFMQAHFSPDLALQNKSGMSPLDLAKTLGLYRSIFGAEQGVLQFTV